MPVDRLRPRYSLRSMACLLRIAPSSYHYHHARIGVDKYAGLRARVARAFADSKGRYGYRRVKAALGTVVPEFLRTLVFARPRGDDQFADCTFSPSLDMSR